METDEKTDGVDAQIASRETLEAWDNWTDEGARKEIYEALTAVPDFSRFLHILKDFRRIAQIEAGAKHDKPSECAYALGGADMIDRIRADIVEMLGI